MCGSVGYLLIDNMTFGVVSNNPAIYIYIYIYMLKYKFSRLQ